MSACRISPRHSGFFWWSPIETPRTACNLDRLGWSSQKHALQQLLPALGGFPVKTSFLRAAASGRIQSECVKGAHLHSVLLLLHDLPFEGFLGITILVLFTFDRSQLHLALKAPADFFDSVYRQSPLDPCVKGIQVRLGLDLFRHDGPVQGTARSLSGQSRASLQLGFAFQEQRHLPTAGGCGR